MSRVLMMVDRGDGRVRCAKSWRTWYPEPGWVWRNAPPNCRWWLVEAESADAARDVIVAADPHTHAIAKVVLLRRSPGRILASGGNGGAK